MLGYDNDAARFAHRLATVQVKPASPGGPPVLHDSCEDSCNCCDCQSFKGVAVRELDRWLKSPLAARRPELQRSVATVLANSAAAVWENARSNGTDGPLFSSRWAECTAGTCSACGFEAASHTSAVFALLTQAVYSSPPN